MKEKVDCLSHFAWNVTWKMKYLCLPDFLAAIHSLFMWVLWVSHENNAELEVSLFTRRIFSSTRHEEEVWVSLSHVRMVLQPAAGSWQAVGSCSAIAGWLMGCSSLSALGAVQDSPHLGWYLHTVLTQIGLRVQCLNSVWPKQFNLRVWLWGWQEMWGRGHALFSLGM